MPTEKNNNPFWQCVFKIILQISLSNQSKSIFMVVRIRTIMIVREQSINNKQAPRSSQSNFNQWHKD